MTSEMSKLQIAFDEAKAKLKEGKKQYRKGFSYGKRMEKDGRDVGVLSEFWFKASPLFKEGYNAGWGHQS